MAFSIQRAVSDGTMTLLPISIEYFDREEISVLFDGVLNARQWAWVGTTDSTLSFTPAVANGVEIALIRTTNMAEVRHQFSLGAQFTAESLDESLIQILHIAQEASEQLQGTDFYNDIDLHGFKISNVAPGVAAGDAVTKAQMDVHNAEVIGYKDDAAASAAAAAAAATLANTYKSDTQTIKNNAEIQFGLPVGFKATPKSSDTGSAAIPTGTTADRDVTPQAGYFRYNTTNSAFEGYNGTAWVKQADENSTVTLAGVQTLTNKTLAASTNTVEATSGPSSSQFSFRNKIINGAFGINQRAYVSGAATTAGQYTLDRWKVTGTGVIAFSTTNNKTTVTIPAGQTLRQVIEGLNLATGNYVLSWEGTAQGRIDGGSYGASGSVKASITGGANTTIEFNSGTVTNVQLEAGSIATPFEHRPYGLELSLCQRYYEVTSNTELSFSGQVTSGSLYYVTGRFAVEKRAAPTMTYTTGSVNAFNAGNPSNSSASTSTYRAVTPTANATTVGFLSYGFTASAEL